MNIVDILPVIIYILLIVMLIILIILGIKLIMVINKTDKLIVDVQNKVDSFNGVFKLIDLTSEKLSMGITVIAEWLIGLINKIFRKRKENDEYE